MTIMEKIYIFGAFISIVNIVTVWIICSSKDKILYKVLLAICTKLDMKPDECGKIIKKDL